MGCACSKPSADPRNPAPTPRVHPEFFEHFLDFFGIFKKMFENFRNFQKNVWNFSEFSKNRLEFFGIFKKIVWIFFEFSKNRLDFFGIFKKMFENGLEFVLLPNKSPLPHDGAERPRRHSKKAPTSTFLGSKQRQKVARVATSSLEIDQNSVKRFFLFYKDFKTFIARASEE